MSQWSDDFEETFKNTRRVRELTQEMKIMEYQKMIDKKLSEVIKGKWKRRYK
jgi:hypothetical protein